MKNTKMIRICLTHSSNIIIDKTLKRNSIIVNIRLITLGNPLKTKIVVITYRKSRVVSLLLNLRMMRARLNLCRWEGDLITFWVFKMYPQGTKNRNLSMGALRSLRRHSPVYSLTQVIKTEICTLAVRV